MTRKGTGVNQTPLGESEVFLSFQERLSQVAKVNRSVLIVGERGSGKEIAATRLHYLSDRWSGPLVTVNCAALPPTLIESELFGHESGAFTGANKVRKGRFEEASGGTLFLDEIGLIPLQVQEKILRAVEYNTFERVGSSLSYEVDVRIIGATNADLPALCEEGKFKRDLLDRLSFEVLFIPPLRVRGDDLFLLAHHFGSRMAHECGYDTLPVFGEQVKRVLLEYSWPGNVRELKNVVERAVYTHPDGIIEALEIDPFRNPYQEGPDGTERKDVSLPELDRYEEAKRDLDIDFLRRALGASRGRQSEAASLLGLTYDQFRGLYRKYKDLL